ncbi:MAG: hybrid sensor histidine kinase/response regulator [Leptospiraceae bacterium]|nr:hybrid sensor histidine kinase/response regulator [Leptospiraceae bacterium]
MTLAQDKQILVVEDEAVVLEILATLLKKAGYSVKTARHGQEALSVLENENIPLVITDLRMPVMDGYELIKALRSFEKPPLVLVATGVSELEQVIKIMREGAYDYFVKPIHEEEFIHRVARAYEVAELRRAHQLLEKERQIRIERQLAFRRDMEKILNLSQNRLRDEIFHHLRTSLTQGGGFGSLLPLLSLLKVQARKEGSYYCIDEKLMQLVSHNAEMAQKAMEVFAKIEEITQKKLDLKPMSFDHFVELIKETLKELQPYEQIKRTPLKLGLPDQATREKVLHIHKEKFQEAFQELCLNAMKFSEEGNAIYIIIQLLAELVDIAILNVPKAQKNQYPGIKPEYQRLIFEPFFRLDNEVDERYHTLDFGLGLTLVEKIIQRHGGTIYVHNVEDHSDLGKGGKIRVSTSIELPLYAKKPIYKAVLSSKK